MCAPSSSPVKPENTPKSGRFRLWEFTDSAHCLLIGTCLSPDDLIKIGKKLGLAYENGIRDYDIHSFYVQKSSVEGKEARAIHKLLDNRHSGSLRIVSREKDAEKLLILWRQMRDSGDISGGVYAFMTLSHIPFEVRHSIFGEIHMLSHLMGASYRKQSHEVSLLKEEISELKTRKEKAEFSHLNLVADHQKEVDKFHSELGNLKTKLDQKNEIVKPKKPVKSSDSKVARALDSARKRARHAEMEYKNLVLQMEAVRREKNQLQIRLRNLEMSEDLEESESIRLDGSSILYIGGRENLIPLLQSYAKECGANFIHHDGGQEDSVARIDEVLPSVDCVICPINCVSHDACLRAKYGCKKLGKSFMPIRTESQASFRRALKELGQRI